MTNSLFRKALESPSKTLQLKAFVEGPYGGSRENLKSYGTVLLIAGGVGITHQLGHLRDLVSAFGDQTCSTRKAILLWSVRAREQLEWVREWLDELGGMPRRDCELKTLLFVSRSGVGDGDAESKEVEATTEEVGSSEHVEYGRMNVSALVRQEFLERVGAMNVGVGGLGRLADDGGPLLER
jgi:NAD(P)H-flavin reductase